MPKQILRPRLILTKDHLQLDNVKPAEQANTSILMNLLNGITVRSALIIASLTRHSQICKYQFLIVHAIKVTMR